MITIKLPNTGMRKPQDFSVYPKKEGEDSICVQSDKSIGVFDPKTGKGLLSTKGNPSFVNLDTQGTPYTFPQNFVEAAIAQQHPEHQISMMEIRKIPKVIL